MRFTLAAMVSFASFLTCAGQSSNPLPAPSTWQLDPAKSDFGGGPAIKEDVVTVISYSPTLFRYKEHEVMASGQIADLSWEGPMDGTLRRIKGALGSKAAFTAQGEARFLIRGGLTELATFALSKDGSVLTQTVTLRWKSGKEQHAIWVYDRVQ